MTTIETIAEIRKRCDGATAGPWKRSEQANQAFECQIGEYKWTCPPGSAQVRCERSAALIPYGVLYWTDADFIAHARTDLPAVLNALETAVKAFKELHERDCHRVANSIAKLALEQIEEMLK